MVTGYRVAILVGLYLALFGAFALVFAWQNEWTVLVLGAILIGVFFLVRRVSDPDGTDRLSRTVRRVVPAVLVAAGVALVWLTVAGTLVSGWGFFGACVCLVGIGQVVTLWRKRPWAIWAGPGLLVAGVVVCGAGILFGGTLWTLVLGLFLLAPVGLNLFTEAVLGKLEIPGNGRRRVALAIVGVVLAVLGVLLLARLGGLDLLYAAVVGLVLLLLLVGIAVNFPVDIVIVVLVIAFMWTVAPDSEPVPAAVPGEDVLVAMGDSFMSGEGASSFFKGTNSKKENECRRAPSAYGPETVLRGNPAVPGQLLFVACSGARAENIHLRVQAPNDPSGGPPGGLTQLDHIEYLRGEGEIDLVIVSIGGNDALFGEIGRTCVGPGDCTEYGARWLSELSEVSGPVYESYQAIRAYFGASVPVLVVPYPVPINPERCSRSLLTNNEHRFLHEFTLELNSVLSRAARDAGFHYLDEMENAFADRGYRICDGKWDDIGVNFFAVNSVAGVFEEVVNPQNWFHNSLHPNKRGHQAMADVLETWFEDHPQHSAPPNSAVDAGPPRIATLEEIMGDPRFPHCESRVAPVRCADSPAGWMRDQLPGLVPTVLPPLGLLLIGCWLLCVGGIAVVRVRLAD